MNADDAAALPGLAVFRSLAPLRCLPDPIAGDTHRNLVAPDWAACLYSPDAGGSVLELSGELRRLVGALVGTDAAAGEQAAS